MNYKGLWYYFGDDANMYFGLREVNGILYYFGSRMYQDESVTVDGKKLLLQIQWRGSRAFEKMAGTW